MNIIEFIDLLTEQMDGADEIDYASLVIVGEDGTRLGWKYDATEERW